MTGLSFNNQPESTDVGTKPKVGLKGKYIHFVKSTMVHEQFEPNQSVEEPVKHLNRGSRHDIGYEAPESSASRRIWSSKRSIFAESYSRKEQHYQYHNCSPVQRRYRLDNEKGKAKVHNVSTAHIAPNNEKKGKVI